MYKIHSLSYTTSSASNSQMQVSWAHVRAFNNQLLNWGKHKNVIIECPRGFASSKSIFSLWDWPLTLCNYGERVENHKNMPTLPNLCCFISERISDSWSWSITLWSKEYRRQSLITRKWWWTRWDLYGITDTSGVPSKEVIRSSLFGLITNKACPSIVLLKVTKSD